MSISLTVLEQMRAQNWSLKRCATYFFQGYSKGLLAEPVRRLKSYLLMRRGCSHYAHNTHAHLCFKHCQFIKEKPHCKGGVTYWRVTSAFSFFSLQKQTHQKCPFWAKGKNKNRQRGGRHLRFFGWDFHFKLFSRSEIAWQPPYSIFDPKSTTKITPMGWFWWWS